MHLQQNNLSCINNILNKMQPNNKSTIVKKEFIQEDLVTIKFLLKLNWNDMLLNLIKIGMKVRF